MSDQREREAFERWWQSDPVRVKVRMHCWSDGRYSSVLMQEAWEGWQARAQQDRASEIVQYLIDEDVCEILRNAVQVLGEVGSGPGYTATCELEDLQHHLHEMLAAQQQGEEGGGD